MIERLRKYLSLDRVGARIPISPNLLTLASGLAAWIGVPLVWLYGYPPWLFILLSGLLDAIDGSVARGRGMASKGGAFLDSFIDRYSDIAYILYFWNATHPLIALAAVLGTFMISYARCRGESLGVEVRGLGFMERGERVAFLFLVSFLSGVVLEYALLAYTLLVNLAAVHRGVAVFRRLSFKK